MRTASLVLPKIPPTKKHLLQESNPEIPTRKCTVLGGTLAAEANKSLADVARCVHWRSFTSDFPGGHSPDGTTQLLPCTRPSWRNLRLFETCLGGACLRSLPRLPSLYLIEKTKAGTRLKLHNQPHCKVPERIPTNPLLRSPKK